MPFIILDLFGVITIGSYKETCQWIAKKYQLDYDAVYQVVYHKYFTAATMGKMTEAQSFALAVKELNLNETGAELRKIHISFQKLNKPIIKLAQDWKNKKAEIVVFSKNTPRQFNEIVNLYRLNRYFPVIINSYNLGLEKKSKEAMEYLLKRFSHSPAETLLIDDQDYNFINAKKIGIETVLYQNPAQLKREVRNWLNKF
ncbi:MAG: HAD family hydrolase [Patescibacteria group bacterium]|jgi:HAD superfamily hydrolase (TIGR01509 family)